MKTIREIIIKGEKLNKLFAALELLDEISGDFESENDDLTEYENELMKMNDKIWDIYYYNVENLNKTTQNYLKSEAEACRKTFNPSKV